MAVYRIPRPAPAVGDVDWKSSVPLISSLGFIAAMLGLATQGANEAIVVYALSFWHYWIYALAFLLRSAPLAVFKRDAVLTRTVSLIAFGWVYFALPLSLPSLMMVGLGFLLNVAAVRALGVDRTYYGYELEELPPKHVDKFPYSWIPHPMLVGNMAAFGGALLNDEFRRHWWPLAVAHVLLNLAIILMETHVKPERKVRVERGDVASDVGELVLKCLLWSIAGGLAAAALSQVFGRFDDIASVVFAGACCTAYAATLFESYSPPRRQEPQGRVQPAMKS
jgi:protein-S-isoprenylcysteine O-methyltransferase Ste14